MAVTHQSLRRLLPNGKAWRIKGSLSDLIDALGDSVDRVKVFVETVSDESNPKTATDTIDTWLDMFAITAPDGSTLADKRAIVLTALTSIGGQSLDYVNEQLQIAFPNLFIEETPVTTSGTVGVGECGDTECESSGVYTFYYYIRGTYPYFKDRTQIYSILKRTAPSHVVPIFEARSADDDKGIVGLARCGKSRVKRIL